MANRARTCRQGGFTLLEVIIAVTIFAIISLAVYSTFRVGLKAYGAGREQMEVIQSARVTFDLLTRDLRSLYYLPPGAYNQNLIRQRQMQHMQQMRAHMPGVEDLARGLRGQPRPRTPEEEEEQEEQLPGVPIDLSIIGGNSEGFDTLTFVTYQVHWGTAPVKPWALARVKYWVDEAGNLLRSEGPIWVDDVPTFQWQPPRDPNLEEEGEEPEPGGPEEPAGAEQYLRDAAYELIVRNVKEFNLEYGYWTEDGWFQAPEWSSHQRRFRNPLPEIDPFDPRAAAMRAAHAAQPTDDVPAYVTVTLRIGYGEENESVRMFRTRIRLPNSTETYMSVEAMLGGFNPTGPGGQTTPFGGGHGARPR